jgi:hypothetical protein
MAALTSVRNPVSTELPGDPPTGQGARQAGSSQSGRTREIPMANKTKAKQLSTGQKPLCRNPPRPIPLLHPSVTSDPMRMRAIVSTASKWLNGTVLHYCFFHSGHFAVPKKQADAVRKAFATWKAVGIGLQFKEVKKLSEAEVRIGYSVADGSSASSVGRDVLSVPLDQPTTVYGWDLTSPYGRGTALHELGHVLGMEHEHQSPFAGIKWHEQAVYDSLGKPPNSWNHATIYQNILEKLSTGQVQGSSWDADSIMEYEFEPGLIAEPHQYDVNGLTPPGTLSAADKQWVLKWYPAMAAKALRTLQPFHATAHKLVAGQQVDYAIKPTESRKYTIEAKGAADAVLGLFEEVDGVPRLLSGDDDSGENRTASINYKLFQGRNYIARLRVVHPGQSGTTSLMMS